MRAGELHGDVADRMPLAVRYGEAEAARPLEQLGAPDHVAVPAGAQRVDLDEQHAALLLAGHVAQADVGGVRRLVADLESARAPWAAANPWAVVKHLAEVMIRRAQTTGEAAENEAEDTD